MGQRPILAVVCPSEGVALSADDLPTLAALMSVFLSRSPLPVLAHFAMFVFDVCKSDAFSPYAVLLPVFKSFNVLVIFHNFLLFLMSAIAIQ